MQNAVPANAVQNGHVPGMRSQQQMMAQPMHGIQISDHIQSLQSSQMQDMHSQQPLPGPCVANQQPNNFQLQVIAVPPGAPPPEGTILAASPEQFQPMHEIFPQDLCEPSSSEKGRVEKKFRIVNPNTGEEVQASVEPDKWSKAFRIVNPKTGKEVLPDDKENTENGNPPATKFGKKASSSGRQEDVNNTSAA